MKLLEELRNDLTSDSASLSNTLRKAKILAHRLKFPELRRWVASELTGYIDSDDTPDYRRMKTVNLGTFHGAFGSAVKNHVLPTYNLPEPLKDFAENMIFPQSVRELEGMLSQESPRLPWPAEAVMLAQEHIKVEGMVLVAAHKPIAEYAISGILDSVKNRLLDFVLDIPVTDEELEEGDFDRDKVRNVFFTNVYGSQNDVAVGENVSKETRLVIKDDRPSLLDHLRQQGISETDLQALEQALSSEPTASRRELGPKVNSWIGRMVGKAASGAWKIAVEAAPKVLLESLGQFYDW